MSKPTFDSLIPGIYAQILNEDVLMSPLASVLGMTIKMYGEWYPAGNLLLEADVDEHKPFSLRAWLFEPRKITYEGRPYDLLDRDDRPLLVGDVLRKADMYFIVRSRGGANFSEFDGDFYEIKPSRWSVYLDKHPKVNDFVTRFRAAKHAWNNPHEGDDYGDDY